MMPSRVSPAPWRPSASRRWWLVEVGAQQQVVEADHAVHRRPDLVAHRRQELRLQPRGLHRLVARHGQLGGRSPRAAATWPSWPRDLLDQRVGVLVGRHLVGEQHDHARAPRRRAGPASRPGLWVSSWPGTGATLELPWTVGACSASSGSGSGSQVADGCAQRRPARPAPLGVGAVEADRLPRRELRYAVRGELDRLVEAVGLVGRRGHLLQQEQPAGRLGGILVGEHPLGDVLGGPAHRRAGCRPAPARPGRGRGPSVPRRRRGRSGRPRRTRPRPRTTDATAASTIGRSSGWMNCEERLVRRLELVGVDVVDPVQLVGPGHRVRARRPTPSCRSARSTGRRPAAARAGAASRAAASARCARSPGAASRSGGRRRRGPGCG